MKKVYTGVTAAVLRAKDEIVKDAVRLAEGCADIAREVADITIQADDLEGLVDLRQISLALMERIARSYRRIMSVNSLLILLGFLGVLPPATTALMHNLSTLLFSVQNTRALRSE